MDCEYDEDRKGFWERTASTTFNTLEEVPLDQITNPESMTLL
jgi:hypothetical protein